MRTLENERQAERKCNTERFLNEILIKEVVAGLGSSCIRSESGEPNLNYKYINQTKFGVSEDFAFLFLEAHHVIVL